MPVATRPELVSSTAYRELTDDLVIVFSDFQSRVLIHDLQDAILDGTHIKYVNSINWGGLSSTLTAPLGTAIAYQYEISGTEAIEKLLREGMEISFDFDVANPRAIRFLQTNTFELIEGLTTETKEALRHVLVDTYKRGEGSYDAARRLRSSVGLTKRQAGALERFARGLEEEGIKPSIIQKRVDRYSKHMLKYRADRIARTELNRAANHGQLESWRQLGDRKIIDVNVAEKVWMTFFDNRTCPECESADGDRAKLNEPFPVTGLQAPVAHPLCRCAIWLDYKK